MFSQIDVLLVIKYPTPIYIQASFASGWGSTLAVTSQCLKLYKYSYTSSVEKKPICHDLWVTLSVNPNNRVRRSNLQPTLTFRIKDLQSVSFCSSAQKQMGSERGAAHSAIQSQNRQKKNRKPIRFKSNSEL